MLQPESVLLPWDPLWNNCLIDHGIFNKVCRLDLLQSFEQDFPDVVRSFEHHHVSNAIQVL